MNKISPLQVISGGGRRIQGWASGTAADSEDTLNFAHLAVTFFFVPLCLRSPAVVQKIKSYIEVYPFEKAPEAFERMLSNKARFRVVLSHTHAKA